MPLSYSSGKSLLLPLLPRLGSQRLLCVSPLLPLLFCKAFMWGLLTMATGPLFRSGSRVRAWAGGRRKDVSRWGKEGDIWISVSEQRDLPGQLCRDGGVLSGSRAVAKPQRGAKLARVTQPHVMQSTDICPGDDAAVRGRTQKPQGYSSPARAGLWRASDRGLVTLAPQGAAQGCQGRLWNRVALPLSPALGAGPSLCVGWTDKDSWGS